MLTAEEIGYVVADSGARVVVASTDKGRALLGLVDAGEISHLVLWGDDVQTVPRSHAAWTADVGSDPLARAARRTGEAAHSVI